MTQTHTLQRGLAGALVIVAGVMGVLVGPASAADGLTPAEITVSADEVANGTTVTGTASIPVQGADAGDSIIIRHLSSERESVTITQASSTHPAINVTVNRDVGLFGDDEVVVTFVDDAVDTTVNLSIAVSVNNELAGQAADYHNTPVLEVYDDTTGVNLAGADVLRLSVSAGAVHQSDVSFNATHVGNTSEGIPIYQTQFESPTYVATANVHDEYGNDIATDETSPYPNDAVSVVFKNASLGIHETYDTTLAELQSANVVVWGEDVSTLPVGHLDVVIRLGDETGDAIGRARLTVYPGDVGISINGPTTASWNDIGVAVKLDINSSGLGAADLQLTSSSESGSFTVIANGTSHRFNLPEDNQTILSVHGDAGLANASVKPTSNGSICMSVINADPGNYTLAVEVMPSVDDNATRDTVSFRVYGPPTNATGECDRPFVGAIHDPDPFTVTVETLTDATGQPIEADDVRISAIGINNHSLRQVNRSASTLPLTVDSVDPTALAASDIGTGPTSVSVNLTWTANGTTHARWIPIDTVDIVHEVASSATEASNWTPVTAPMPYERIVYENATTGPDGRPLAVRWRAGDGYVPFETAAHARSHLASGWFVAGATRVGYVYADAELVNRTLELSPGWHHLGPPTDLTRQAAWTPAELLAGTNRTGYYNGVRIVEPQELHIAPYDTYWLHTNTTCGYRVPGAYYDPADRVGGDGP